MTESEYLMLLFVHQRIYEGLQPDGQGDYMIRRKEFIERLPMAASTFDNNILRFVKDLADYDLAVMFGLKGLYGENLFVDVRYNKGTLRFKRNPYTLRPELSYIWGIKPTNWEERRFSYPYVPVPENISLPIKR